MLIRITEERGARIEPSGIRNSTKNSREAQVEFPELLKTNRY